MLLEWAIYSCPFGSSTPTITHLNQVKKVTGKTPSQLRDYEASSVPECLRYVYKLYLDFYNGEKFTYAEFNAWKEYIGVELNHLECDIIRQICLEREAFLFRREQKRIEWERSQSPKGK